MTTDKRVTAVLGRFEESTEPFRESAVLSALGELGKEMRSTGIDCPASLQAEGIAFQLVENSLDKEDSWGVYYGPHIIGENEAGERVDIPSLASITPEIVDYWEERARSTTHPILRSRYADLVWEFSKTVCKKGADVELARMVIDDNVSMITGHLCKAKAVTPIKLRRALRLALSIGDEQRVDSVRAVVLAENRDGYWYVWETIYDELLDNKAARLSESEHAILIQSLEKETETDCKSENPSMTQVESMCLWLAAYYRKRRQTESVRRILALFAESMLRDIPNYPAMTAATRCERVHDVYREYGLNAEADALIPRMEALCIKSRNEMERFPFTFEIPKHELDEWVDGIVEESLELACQNIAVHFTEDEDKARAALPELAKAAPLMHLCRNCIVNEDGVTIATIGLWKDDEEGNLVSHMAKGMKFSAPILRAALEAVQRKYAPSVDQILGILYMSPAFNTNRRSLIKQGLTAYFGGDYVTALHLLIPQFEYALRHLARLLNLPVYRKGKHGGFQLRNLDELLKMEIVVRTLSKQCSQYFRVLFTDQRGWNLRNEVCHGLSRPEEFNVAVADRVFHSLLVLSLLRVNAAEYQETEPDASPTEVEL